MEIGELRPLKEMAVKPESVFRMRFYPQDGVVPKDANDSSSDKYFVKNPKQRIGVFQYQINKYYFLNGKNRFADC